MTIYPHSPRTTGLYPLPPGHGRYSGRTARLSVPRRHFRGICILFLALTCLAGPILRQAEAETFRPMVIYHWSIDGNPYNVSIHKGVERFTRKTGLPCTERVLEGKMDKYVSYVDEVAREGYSPIFLLYGSHYPELAELARRHPATRFIVFDAVIDEPNMYSFHMSDHESSYLAGVLAAMATRSGILGFVSVVDLPGMRRFLCGYSQGARLVDPDILVLSGFTGRYKRAWFDGKATSKLANRLMDQGADVVFQVAGGAGPAVLEAVAKRGKLGIGVDVNQNGLYPGHVLTSVLKRNDMAVYAALMLARRGIWRDNLKRLGMAQGAVDIVFDRHNAPLITDEMRRKVEKIRKEIVVGRITVHDYATDHRCP